MKITLHESYVLVETDDIDFSILRAAAANVIIEHSTQEHKNSSSLPE